MQVKVGSTTSNAATGIAYQPNDHLWRSKLGGMSVSDAKRPRGAKLLRTLGWPTALTIVIHAEGNERDPSESGGECLAALLLDATNYLT